MPREALGLAKMTLRKQLEADQLSRLNGLLDVIAHRNRFFAAKLAGVSLPLASLGDLSRIPLTTKEELVEAGFADSPANLTFPLANYSRFHQTSGTRGRPLRVFDTAEDWQWWVTTWQWVLDAANVEPSDRALMAFSFGPFIGFWSANDALVARGCLVVPTGGMSTIQRLRVLDSTKANIVCCTPTYALRMAEVAAEQGIDLRSASVKALIVAGEPGGSIPSVRDRIQAAWGADVVDHAGATEVGPWGFADDAREGLFVTESEFIAEFLPVEGTALKELVLTALGRTGWPVLRYRTGDLVEPDCDTDSTHGFVHLRRGVVGRVDEMLVIKGVNVYPSAIDEIVRSVPSIEEYRAIASRKGAIDQLRIEFESGGDSGLLGKELGGLFERRLGLHVEVLAVPPGTLPRYEAKSRRLVDERVNVYE